MNIRQKTSEKRCHLDWLASNVVEVNDEA
jgi:hypothetical protein